MSLFRQAATLLLGTGAAQVLSLAALPLLTRLYAPADFGVFAFFAAIVMLAGPLICARLGFAVPIPAEEEEARDLLGVATRIGLTSSVLAAVGLATVHAGLVPGERLRDLPGWTSWIPASLFLTSLYQPFSYWFTRNERFRSISVSRVWQSGAAGLAQVAAGFGGFAGPNGLIGGSILGQLAAVLTLEAAARPGERLLDRLARPRGSPRSLLFRHRDFPIFSSGSGLLQIATDQLPILLIPFLFGSTVAGHFALPARLLQAVVALLSFTTAQAFYPHAARRERDGVLATSCLDIHRTLCRWTLVPLAIGAVVASDGFGMAFGSDWIDSGDYFRRLVPWFFVAIPFASLNQVFPIVGKQRQQLLLNAGVVAVGAGALGAGAVWFDARGTVLLFSATGAAVRIAGIEWALRLAGAPPGKGMLALLLETARALPFLAIQLGVRAFVVPPAASIAVAILLVGVHFARCATSRPQSERRG